MTLLLTSKADHSVEQERQFTYDAREFVAGSERVVRELNLLEDLWGQAMDALTRGSSVQV